MPSRRSFLHRRPGIASTSQHFRGSNPESSSVASNAPTTLPMASLRSHPNNVSNDTSRPVWDAALAVASIVDKIPSVPLALAGPLTQILDVASATMDIVKTMREGQEGCIRLIYRVLNFLQSLVEELRTIKAPVPDDTPTAARLFALKRFFSFRSRWMSCVLNNVSFCGSNLMAIRDDADRWARLGLLEKYLKRDEIKTGLSRHGENLTDCFSTFQILTSIRSSNFTDRVETIMFPGPSVLMIAE
ncbi:hypothetical protein BS47DRAFT_456835 [Hydnum rufescens UP504]|uniref:Uncharacterized protein n=1 Tax=Hydnum rufescens UP504 TaxID=1448309 RepID=A0A9P6DPE6_9AGAM|nr:hypothetical protein BS47DRAFT_456835 [Hydnum rufescens UP504]